MPYVYLIVIVNEMVESVQRFTRAQAEQAEEAFVATLLDRAGDKFPPLDIPVCLEDGYVELGQCCSIQLHWSDK